MKGLRFQSANPHSSWYKSATCNTKHFATPPIFFFNATIPQSIDLLYLEKIPPPPPPKMNSPAFVTVAPFVARSSSHITTAASSSFTSRIAPAVHVTDKRARIVMSIDEEDKSVPQGFTSFSEQLNGRAAMIGFILAVATEAITGQGIVGQIGSITKVFEGNSPF